MHFIPVDYIMCSYHETQTEHEIKMAPQEIGKSSCMQKTKEEIEEIIVAIFRKHIVIQKDLAQQEKTTASEGDPQADKMIYYASRDDEIQTTTLSKYGNVNLHPTKLSVSSYSGYNHLHGFTTSFADADTKHLNIQVPFDTYSIFFDCDNSTTGHICNDLLKFIPGTLQQTN